MFLWRLKIQTEFIIIVNIRREINPSNPFTERQWQSHECHRGLFFFSTLKERFGWHASPLSSTSVNFSEKGPVSGSGLES